MNILETEHEPVNRQAAIAISRTPKTAMPSFAKSSGQEDLEWRVEKALQQRRTTPMHDAKNWSGVKRGKLTITFYAGLRKREKKDTVHYWLARCECGGLVIRTGAALARKLTGVDACDTCQKTDRLKDRGKRNQLINWEENK